MTCRWHVRTDCSVPLCHSVTFPSRSGENFSRPTEARNERARTCQDATEERSVWIFCFLFNDSLLHVIQIVCSMQEVIWNIIVHFKTDI